MRKHTILPVAIAVVVTLAGYTGVVGAVEATPASTAVGPSADVGPSAAPLPAGPNGTLAVHFINTGQGTSTLVVGPTNETMLIDTGDWQDDGAHVLAYLRAQDIQHLDYLVTTHADADHIGGHAAVIEYFETEANGVGAVYDPGITAATQTYERYLDAIEQYDVTLYETRAGDRIPFAGADVRVLAPPASPLAGGDRNENSLVLRVGFGPSSFLFPGDAAAESEEYLVSEYGSALNATVLQAGHHGSNTSTGASFLAVVSPHVAVISSPVDSRYGHPHADVLQRLAARSVTTYWTGTHGDLVLTSNGTAIAVTTQQRAPTAPLALRNGTAIAPAASESVEVRTVINIGGQTQVAADGGIPPENATGTPTDGNVSIAEIHADATGDEYENLNDEYIVLENTGTQPVDLSGWTITDEADHVYSFPEGFTLAAGATVTVHTGSGTDTETDLYWLSDQPVWNNDGDTVIVRDADGNVVIEERYP